MNQPPEEPSSRPAQPALTSSRRALLGSALATVGGAAAIGLGGAGLAARPAAPEQPSLVDEVVPSSGVHQAGIDTPQQRYATLVAADLTVRDAGALRGLFRDLTTTIARITRGEDPPPSPIFPPGASVPTDFATGLSPSRLTITVGVGPRVFTLPGIGRPAPERLHPLPAFDGDGLDPRWSDGDLLLQICADDAQVVSAAMRSLRARLPGYGRLRWTQSGFLSTPVGGGTPPQHVRAQGRDLEPPARQRGARPDRVGP